MPAEVLKMKTTAQDLPLLSPAARAAAEPIVERFRREKLSGQVTITLHFMRGKEMPADVGMVQKQVGERTNLLTRS